MPDKLSRHLDIKKKKKKKKDNDISWATTRYLYQRSKEEDVGRYDEQTHLQLRYVHAIAYMQTIRCRAPCASAAAMKDFPHVCVCVCVWRNGLHSLSAYRARISAFVSVSAAVACVALDTNCSFVRYSSQVR